MPIEGIGNNLFGSIDTIFIVKAFFVLFLIFYAFFAVILFRQVQIMNRKLQTQLSALLKFVAFLHIGVSVSLLFLVIGAF